MEYNLENIPGLLIEYRLKNRHSQGVMGELLGESQQVYSNIEKGKNKKYSHEFVELVKSLLSGNLTDLQNNIVNGTKKKEPKAGASQKKAPRFSTDGNKKTSKKLNDNEKETLNSSSRTKNGDYMTMERVLGIAEKLAIATERDSQTRKSLADTIEWMRRKMDEGNGLKRQAN